MNDYSTGRDFDPRLDRGAPRTAEDIRRYYRQPGDPDAEPMPAGVTAEQWLRLQALHHVENGHNKGSVYTHQDRMKHADEYAQWLITGQRTTSR